MSLQLPPNPNLQQLKNQAKDVLKASRKGDPEAEGVTLQEAQHALAMEYGFRNWSDLKANVLPRRDPNAPLETLTRPGDEVRQDLLVADVREICRKHGIKEPNRIVSEPTGDEKVTYYLDESLVLSYCLCPDAFESLQCLLILKEIDEVPVPKIVAWGEKDPKKGFPYMITERIPGQRLDVLWRKTSPAERAVFLDALGRDMATYHNVGAEKLSGVANKLSLERLVSTVPQLEDHLSQTSEIMELVGDCSSFLSEIGIDAAHEMKVAEKRCASLSPRGKSFFISPGLTIGDLCDEHLFLHKLDDLYRLSGCIDMEAIHISDATGELSFLYCTFLGMEESYYSSFKAGYESRFAFPEDAKEVLELDAIRQDLAGIVHWYKRFPEPVPGWIQMWLKRRFRRLQGWLGTADRPKNLMDYADVGWQP